MDREHAHESSCWRCGQSYTGYQRCDGCQGVLRICLCYWKVRESNNARRHGYVCTQCYLRKKAA